MTSTIDNAKDGLQSVLQSEDFKKILPYLLAGGAGAVAGGVATGRRNERKGESRSSHAGRVLRNALVAGGLAAGGTALLRKGLGETTGAVDKAGPITGGTADNEGPLSSTLKGLLFSPVTAAASGATGLALTHGRKHIGAAEPGASEAIKSLAKHLTKGDTAALRALDPQTLAEKIRAVGNIHGADADKLRRIAGLAAGKDERGVASRIAHSLPFSTFGSTAGRRIGRTGLGLVAASIPALVGAFVTDKAAEQ